MTSFSSWTPGALLTLLALTGLANLALGAEASRGEHRLLAARDLVMLVVENPFGGLEVIGEDRDEIELEVQYRVRTRSADRARAIVEALRIDLVEVDGRLRLIPMHGDDFLGDSRESHLRGAVLRMDILARVPSHLALNAGVTDEFLKVSGLDAEVLLRATSGSVELQDLDTDATLTLTSGDASGRNLAGDLTVTATSGDLEFERVGGDAELVSWTGTIAAENVAGSLMVESESGDINLSEIHGDLRVLNASGGISIRDPGGDVRVNSAGGSVSLFSLLPFADEDPPRIRITSSSGTVAIGVHPKAGYHIDLSTDMGAMRVKLPLVVEDISRRHLAGRLGDGKGELQVVTATGDIRITLTDE